MGFHANYNLCELLYNVGDQQYTVNCMVDHDIHIVLLLLIWSSSITQSVVIGLMATRPTSCTVEVPPHWLPADQVLML